MMCSFGLEVTIVYFYIPSIYFYALLVVVMFLVLESVKIKNTSLKTHNNNE